MFRSQDWQRFEGEGERVGAASAHRAPASSQQLVSLAEQEQLYTELSGHYSHRPAGARPMLLLTFEHGRASLPWHACLVNFRCLHVEQIKLVL